MTDINTSENFETVQANNDTIESVFYELIDLDPKLIGKYVPTNAAEQKELFLKGEVRNPAHHYEKLEEYDFDAAQSAIVEVGDKLISHPDLNPKFKDAYEMSIDTYGRKTRLMEIASKLATSESAERQQLEADYMELNIELYGKPEEAVYRQMIAEKIHAIQAKPLTESAQQLLREVIQSVGMPEVGINEKFVPSKETVEWMHGVVEALYGNLLKRVPEQDSFSDEEVRTVFEGILREEFGIEEGDWTVSVESASAINVKSDEKRIVIPTGRKLTQLGVKRMVVHEIGVHFLRSIQGRSTDAGPLQHGGLDGYYDTEEGLGSVMEQALVGEYKEVGIGHYVSAGAAYFDKMDFRDTFDLKWKLLVLEGLKDDEEPTPEKIEKAQKTSYSSVFRTFRGTDTLPWFKDLAYYNGAQETWRHLEEIKGDDLKFSFVLMGKANAADKTHEQLLYETSTK